jgi:hypothetical protein
MLKSLLIAVIAVAAAVAVAFLLNPSPEQHRARIKETIAQRNPVEGLLGIGMLTAFTARYTSLGVASYTTVSERTVSVGALGVVVVAE